MLALVFNCSNASSVRTKFGIFGDSVNLRIPLTVAESRTNSYIRMLRDPRHNKCADKIYVTGICTRNLR